MKSIIVKQAKAFGLSPKAEKRARKTMERLAIIEDYRLEMVPVPPIETIWGNAENDRLYPRIADDETRQAFKALFNL